MPNMHPRKTGSRARRGLVVAALSLIAMAAGAMEDESMYSYTKVEADAGRLRGGAAGSAQSIGVDGWVGGDVNRLWYQFDGQAQGGRTETAATQLLYGRYIAPFWDAQVGLRHDQRPGRRDALAVGVRGLAPYAFDVDLKLYLRDDGRLLGLSRFENDILLTNRFIVRPFLSVEWSASNLDPTVRRGPYRAELGLQARYEFDRRVAPYVSLSRIGYPVARTGGERPATWLRAGLRLIF